MKGENHEQLQVVSRWAEGRGRRAGNRCAGRRVWLIWKPRGRNFDHATDTADSSAPVDVVGLNGGVAAVSAGGRHSCAVTLSGAAKCWGGNQFGQLGDDTRTTSAGSRQRRRAWEWYC
jgi:alpha-tubulin suppressor-like RCC1 family protein